VDEGEKEFDAVGRIVSKENGPRADRRRLLASSYMGIICRARGHYSRAEEYYKKALRDGLKLNDTAGIASQLGNLGILYRHTGDRPMAIRFLNACLLYSESQSYRKGIRFSCANLYETLAESGQAPEARRLKELYEARYPGMVI
jgi:tetratricopeptide (TPR) repeat protein